jgi:hypothetical protein
VVELQTPRRSGGKPSGIDTISLDVRGGSPRSSSIGAQGAPADHSLFVEVRWCYNKADAVPFAFDIMRAEDGQNFRKVASIGGGTNANCSTSQFGRPFFYRDNSADLEIGKTYTYKIVARGANTAESNSTVTKPLPPFMANLVSPSNENSGVSLNPTYVWKHPQLAVGADGASYSLIITDPMAGSAATNTIFAEQGTDPGTTGEIGNGVPVGQNLVYSVSLAGLLVWTDTAGLIDETKPNLIPITNNQVNVMHNVVFAPFLQSLRTYQWGFSNGFRSSTSRSYAYTYLPGEGFRVNAYTIQTSSGSGTPGGGQNRPVTELFSFQTGQ